MKLSLFAEIGETIAVSVRLVYEKVRRYLAQLRDCSAKRGEFRPIRLAGARYR
jgi:hypothetical protein